ncbi:MAG: hypothetical protein M0Z89_09605 [Nitrospiraceae bacterium]|nr:hypothetical protein [Nitrospiraceae bacterium]
MESLEEFVNRLVKDIHCFYHTNRSGKVYSLKKYDSNQRGKMGVFAWGLELKRKDKFEIATYKHLGDEVGVSNSQTILRRACIIYPKKKTRMKKVQDLFFMLKRQ